MRHEFPAAVCRAADARANGRCEATGPRYGLAEGVRCNADLASEGKERDHYPLGAHAEGSETLDNCVVCCRRCNQYAANHTDKAAEARIKRVRRKHGLDPDTRKPRKSIPARKAEWPKRQMQKRVK
jgi:predicted ATPase